VPHSGTATSPPKKLAARPRPTPNGTEIKVPQTNEIQLKITSLSQVETIEPRIAEASSMIEGRAAETVVE
jgi:hypothetical protein